MGTNEKLSKYKRELLESRLLEFNKINKDEIEKDLILYKYTTYDLKSKYSISYRFLKHYLTKYDLLNIALKNGQLKIKNTAVINGKKSKYVLGDIQLKVITDEIIEWYKNSINSGMYRMEVMNELKNKFGFGRKKYNQLVKLYGQPLKNPQSGSLNPMYGKSPSLKSGIGIKSHINIDGKHLFCRSLLELRIYLHLYLNGIKFEISQHRIPYQYKNKNYTYCPDITLIDENTVVEIKPKTLINSKINVIKFNSARKYCSKYNLNFNVITDHSYDIDYINLDVIDHYIKCNIINITEFEYDRLKTNLK